MKKSRVIWGLWLVLAVIFCFVTDGVTGYLLLAVSIVLPLLSGITLVHAYAFLSFFTGGKGSVPFSGFLGAVQCADLDRRGWQ